MRMGYTRKSNYARRVKTTVFHVTFLGGFTGVSVCMCVDFKLLFSVVSCFTNLTAWNHMTDHHIL